jgi:tRNA(Ile)-lysidine synthase TilS/MesJ
MISYKKLVRDIDLDKKIYIAFSGGVDSSALLYLFKPFM